MILLPFLGNVVLQQKTARKEDPMRKKLKEIFINFCIFTFSTTMVIFAPKVTFWLAFIFVVGFVGIGCAYTCGTMIASMQIRKHQKVNPPNEDEIIMCFVTFVVSLAIALGAVIYLKKSEAFSGALIGCTWVIPLWVGIFSEHIGVSRLFKKTK